MKIKIGEPKAPGIPTFPSVSRTFRVRSLALISGPRSEATAQDRRLVRDIPICGGQCGVVTGQESAVERVVLGIGGKGRYLAAIVGLCNQCLSSASAP